MYVHMSVLSEASGHASLLPLVASSPTSEHVLLKVATLLAFTGTTVQILTSEHVLLKVATLLAFAGTTVQILTSEHVLVKAASLKVADALAALQAMKVCVCVCACVCVCVCVCVHAYF
jgi:hypothetical protein